MRLMRPASPASGATRSPRTWPRWASTVAANVATSDFGSPLAAVADMWRPVSTTIKSVMFDVATNRLITGAPARAEASQSMSPTSSPGEYWCRSSKSWPCPLYTDRWRPSSSPVARRTTGSWRRALIWVSRELGGMGSGHRDRREDRVDDRLGRHVVRERVERPHD